MFLFTCTYGKNTSASCTSPFQDLDVPISKLGLFWRVSSSVQACFLVPPDTNVILNVTRSRVAGVSFYQFMPQLLVYVHVKNSYMFHLMSHMPSFVFVVGRGSKC